ncbi:MSHA biogenesis protein MshP [Halospina denitrificans]|uniref:MSHA biogenesis protein MshP n=1 Tax=Halospina denitrificans TaxID=332522 RepID=A0A4R7JGR1_9GAMM|nr:hypothetical protein [Halospina denitrificans]TDT36991.1 MSHA biogenesis protein MshP [Halospina denitrificans]
MCPDHCLYRYQRGVGLPLAIFLITVMALIVATIAQLQQTTGEMEGLDIQSGRAYYAAESGAQLGMTFQDEGEGCGFSQQTFNGFQQGIEGCEATVTCQELGGADPMFEIESVGECGSGQDRARRTVEVLAR